MLPSLNFFFTYLKYFLDVFREVHERNTRILTSRLRSLYNLLCYLYNLRTKDLRTKVKKNNA
jgi:hypothetical protein